MTLRFEPPKQVARYALFVDYDGSGRGYFKTYNDLRHAKIAYRYHNYSGRYNAKILEMVAGEWYVLYDIKAGTELRDLPWYKEVNEGWRTGYRKTKKAVPMTRDEYADWRVAVEHERLGI